MVMRRFPPGQQVKVEETGSHVMHMHISKAGGSAFHSILRTMLVSANVSLYHEDFDFSEEKCLAWFGSNPVFAVVRQPQGSKGHALSMFRECKYSEYGKIFRKKFLKDEKRRGQDMRIVQQLHDDIFTSQDAIGFERWLEYFDKWRVGDHDWNCINPINLQYRYFECGTFIGNRRCNGLHIWQNDPSSFSMNTTFKPEIVDRVHVGLSERLEDSACLLIFLELEKIPPLCCRTKGDTSPPYKFDIVKSHGVPRNASLIHITDRSQELIQKQTLVDQKLYEHVKFKFKRQWNIYLAQLHIACR